MFYYRIELHVGTSISYVDAPRVTTLPTAGEHMGCAVLERSMGPSIDQGLYVWGFPGWRFLLSMSDLSWSIIKGHTLKVFVAQTEETTDFGMNAKAYRNGQLQDQAVVTEDPQYAWVVTIPIQEQGLGTVKSVNTKFPDEDGAITIRPSDIGDHGVAELSSEGKVRADQSLITSVNTQTGAVVLTASNVGAIDATEKGVEFGVATLGAGGILVEAQRPPIIFPVTSVNNRTGEVALDSQDVGAIPETEKGANSGVATLDSSGKIPLVQIPDDVGKVKSVNSKTGVVTLDSQDVGAIPETEKGANSGVATLDSNGKLPISQLPDIDGGSY